MIKQAARAANFVSTRKLLLIYACLSAVYLLYLPHALPVLDDWTYLQRFSQARARGLSGEIALFEDLVSNHLLSQFRIFWAGFVPVVAVSLAAGFTAWPYYLLALICHLLTAVLLDRTVSMLAHESDTGFIAGAIYTVLPAVNGALFWPIATSFYFVQALALTAWFCMTWKKLAIREDFRFGTKDFLLLALVAFTGEQILPALMALLPVTCWLFGKSENRGRAMRYWISQFAALLALLGFYVLALNRMPVRGGIEIRYPGAGRWSPWPVVVRLLAALGLRPSFAEWTPAWRLDPALIALLAAAGVALFWAFFHGSPAKTVEPRRTSPQTSSVVARPAARLLAWSVAGAALTYLPVALLPGIEWRYLYVPAGFLSAGVAAALSFLPRPARAVLAFFAVAYGISLTYFEMRQCWIPQSREAQAILSVVAAAPPRPREVFIFAHAPHAMGTAPAFIAGASWSMNSMLEHYAGSVEVQGAREVLVDEQGDLALYRRDSLAPFSRAEIGRLRVFVRSETGRYAAKSVLALSAGNGRLQLFPLRPGIECPPQPLAMGELKRLPFFDGIYFAHPVKTVLPIQTEQPHA